MAPDRGTPDPWAAAGASDRAAPDKPKGPNVLLPNVGTWRIVRAGTSCSPAATSRPPTSGYPKRSSTLGPAPLRPLPGPEAPALRRRPRRPHFSNRIEIKPVEAERKVPEERRRRLRECFRLKPEAVGSAVRKMRRAEALDVDSSHCDDEAVLLGIQRLLHCYEQVEWQELPRKSPRLPEESFTSAFQSEAINTKAVTEDRCAPDAALGAEMGRCLAFVDFVRYLCHLPPVRHNLAKQRACEALSQTLLPRQVSDPLPGNKLAMMDFTDELTTFAEDHSDELLILHWEASLVSAVQQGFNSTHVLKALGQQLPPIRASFASSCSGERAQSARKVKEVIDCSKAETSTSTPLTAENLPPALQHLRALWLTGQPLTLTPAVPALAPARPRSFQGAAASSSTCRTFRKAGDTAPSLPTTPRMLDPVWGDKNACLRFRRMLLSPALCDLGASRCQDSCVFWLGMSTAIEVRPAAVCFPPCGHVPRSLVTKGAPWTIMPDYQLFQPTTEISVQAWRVRIEREEGNEVDAVRLEEVKVQSIGVDCSATGDAFCVAFLPELNCFEKGAFQLEVCLSGLCGPSSELAFFYEIQSFAEEEREEAFLAEAAKLRGHLGSPSLQSPAESSASPSSDVPNLTRVSHKEDSFASPVPDVNIYLQGQAVAVLKAELHMMRYGDEIEHLVHGCQVHHLASGYFWVRVKLPLSRYRYELRFFVSSLNAPEQFEEHSLRYTIAAGEKCPPILHSLDGFGCAAISPLTQLIGLTLLAPLDYKLLPGSCYFLVKVDTDRLLEAMQRTAQPAPPSPPGSSLFSQRLALEAKHHTNLGEASATAAHRRHRLHKERRAAPSNLLAELQSRLHQALECRTQDSSGERFHLDLFMGNGECPARLRQRQDLQGYFEGLLYLTEENIGSLVHLRLRTPALHPGSFAPIVVCEWTVCSAQAPR